MSYTTDQFIRETLIHIYSQHSPSDSTIRQNADTGVLSRAFQAMTQFLSRSSAENSIESLGVSISHDSEPNSILQTIPLDENVSLTSRDFMTMLQGSVPETLLQSLHIHEEHDSSSEAHIESITISGNVSERRPLSLHYLTLATHQVEILFVLSALLSGKRRVFVQVFFLSWMIFVKEKTHKKSEEQTSFRKKNCFPQFKVVSF